jgi:hypothetical protein
MGCELSEQGLCDYETTRRMFGMLDYRFQVLGRPVVRNGAVVDGITQGLLLHAPMEGNQHVSPTSIFDSSSCLGWFVLEALRRYPRNADQRSDILKAQNIRLLFLRARVSQL